MTRDEMRKELMKMQDEMEIPMPNEDAIERMITEALEVEKFTDEQKEQFESFCFWIAEHDLVGPRGVYAPTELLGLLRNGTLKVCNTRDMEYDESRIHIMISILDPNSENSLLRTVPMGIGTKKSGALAIKVSTPLGIITKVLGGLVASMSLGNLSENIEKALLHPVSVTNLPLQIVPSDNESAVVYPFTISYGVVKDVNGDNVVSAQIVCVDMQKFSSYAEAGICATKAGLLRNGS